MWDYKKLRSSEIKHLKMNIEKYKEYDKLDLLMLITFGKDKLDSINNRKEELIEEEIYLNQAPEAIKYCTSDKCMVPYN